MVERTFGWLMFHRRLARDYEALPARGDLGGPFRGGMGGDTENTDAAGSVLDDREDVVGRAVERGRREEVACQDRVGLAAEEAGPGLAVAFGGGFDAVLLRICHTVEGATLMPRVVSSPWMRR
jgi:hypothetical protein